MEVGGAFIWYRTEAGIGIFGFTISFQVKDIPNCFPCLCTLWTWLKAHMIVNHFSHQWKINKPTLHSRLTDEYLHYVLRMANVILSQTTNPWFLQNISTKNHLHHELSVSKCTFCILLQYQGVVGRLFHNIYSLDVWICCASHYWWSYNCETHNIITNLMSTWHTIQSTHNTPVLWQRTEDKFYTVIKWRESELYWSLLIRLNWIKKQKEIIFVHINAEISPMALSVVVNCFLLLSMTSLTNVIRF